MKRKSNTHFTLFVVFFLLYSCASASALVLVENGVSDYRIVIPAEATSYEKKAATELQFYLDKISGVKLPILNDSEGFFEKEIIIGKNKHLEEIKCRIKFDKLDTDGFEIRTKDDYLVIAGGSEKGCLYGVYTFLETYLGCRYYAPGDLYIPKLSTIHVEEITERQIPVFDFREMYFPVLQDSSYLLWHKLDRHYTGNWGMWVHTFDDLVPPDEYFELHPEYFSLVGNKRVKDGQLCLSNPDVLDTLITNLGKKIDNNPEALYWSVSQNDNYLACECEQCKVMNEKYGGPSGTMIYFVNKVAREFPDKIISTLAYQYTRHAPKGIKPEKNVNIMLCTIECNRSLPIDRDPSGEAFVNDLKAWSKLSDDILLWDYVVQFRNYVSPFPNFHVLQPNLQLFEKFGCNMMFQQGSGRSWSDLAEMKAYLIAKLLWDPDTDADVIINDFLYGYYGDAAPFLREYFDTLHEELIQSGANLWIYGYPYDAINTFLTPSLQERYNLLFDQAEEAVKGDPKIIKRVQKARLPIQFAALDISLFNYNDEFSYFTTVDGNLAVKEEKAELLDLFVENCVEAGIERLQEHGTSPEEYREKTGDFILKCLESNLARSKNVGVLSRFSPKYNSRGEKALTDGLRGMNDYHYNWLGFEGEELVAIVDLEEIQTVNHLSADFLQNTGAWIFLPQEVHFYGSIDGIEYTLIGLTENIVPYQFPGPFILSFDTDIPDTRIRYLRIETRSMKTCPDWHIGAGEKSWIFTDEIIVR